MTYRESRAGGDDTLRLYQKIIVRACARARTHASSGNSIATVDKTAPSPSYFRYVRSSVKYCLSVYKTRERMVCARCTRNTEEGNDSSELRRLRLPHRGMNVLDFEVIIQPGLAGLDLPRTRFKCYGRTGYTRRFDPKQ